MARIGCRFDFFVSFVSFCSEFDLEQEVKKDTKREAAVLRTTANATDGIGSRLDFLVPFVCFCSRFDLE